MSYVEKNLIKDEQIVYKAKIHWFIYIIGIVVILIGNKINAADAAGNDAGRMVLATGIVLLLHAFILQRTTELVVTSKRVIGKFGFIRRETIEILHQKIESVKVDQGIWGRIFNFGDVIIQGSGGATSPVKFIKNPVEFRKKAMEYVDMQSSR